MRTLLLLACASEPTAAPALDEVRFIHLLPEAPTAADALPAPAEATPPDAPLTWSWRVDGVDPGVAGPALEVVHHTAGQAVEAIATTAAGDSHTSYSLLIANTPPEVPQVWIDPEGARAGDPLTCRAEAADLDGHALTWRYRWSGDQDPYRHEGAELPLEMSSLPGTWICYAAADDGLDRGLEGRAEVALAWPDHVRPLREVGHWIAAEEGRRVGLSVAYLGDVDGDGLSDLVLTDHGSVRAWVVTAARLAGRASLDADADATWRLHIGPDAGGEIVPAVGDIDGDGLDEVALGAWRAHGPRAEHDYAGRLFVFSPARLSAGGDHGPADAQAVIGGEGGSALGRSLLIAGGALFAGAPYLDVMGAWGYSVNIGRVYRFEGATLSGGHALAPADAAIWTGPERAELSTRGHGARRRHRRRRGLGLPCARWARSWGPGRGPMSA